MKIHKKLVLTTWLVPSLQRSFSTSQYAFVPNSNFGTCCNALTLARIWTLKALDEDSSYVSWLAIDFRKAFDTVLDTLVNDILVWSIA
jgi:hypothetical protein